VTVSISPKEAFSASKALLGTATIFQAGVVVDAVGVRDRVGGLDLVVLMVGIETGIEDCAADGVPDIVEVVVGDTVFVALVDMEDV